MKKMLLIAAPTVVVCFTLLFSYLFFTEKGLKFLIKSAQTLTDEEIQVSRVSGSLAHKFALEGISYVSSASEININTLSIYWNPLALLGGKVKLYLVEIDKIHLKRTNLTEEVEKEKLPEISLPEIEFPLDFEIDGLAITDILVQNAPDAETAINKIYIEANGVDGLLTIDTFVVSTSRGEVNLSGNTRVRGDWPVDIVGKWKYFDNTSAAYQGTFTLSETFRAGNAKLIINSPFNGSLDTSFAINGGFSWSTIIMAKDLDPSFAFPEFTGKIDINTYVKGAVSKDGLSGKAEIKAVEGTLRSQPLLLEGQIEVDKNVVTLSTIEGKVGRTELSIKGHIGEEIDVGFSLFSPDLGEFLPSVAGEVQVSGNIEGSPIKPYIKAQISGKDLLLQETSVASLTAEMEGEISKDGELSMNTRLENLKKDNLFTDDVDVRISGSLDNHTINMDILEEGKKVHLRAAGGIMKKGWSGVIDEFNISLMEKGVLQLEDIAEFAVEAGEVHLGDLCMSHEQSSFCLQGQLQDQKWQVDMKLKQFDPSFISLKWQGKVDATLVGSGDFSAKDLIAYIELSNLEGVVNEIPLTGKGNIEMADNQLICKDFDLRYGKAIFSANGKLGDSYDFAFHGKVPDMSNIMSGFGGEFSLSGEVSGDREKPILSSEFTASNGKFEDLAFTSLKGDVAVDLRRNGNINIDIQGSGIEFSEHAIYKSTILANGTTLDHSINFSASTSEGDISLTAKGGYESSWKGLLEKGALSSNKHGNWSLKEKAQIEIGSEAGSISNLCLLGTKTDVCLGGSFSERREWSLRANIQQFSLDVLRDYQLVRIPLSGDLQGVLNAEGTADTINHLESWAAVSELQIKEGGAETDLEYTFLDNRLTAELINNSLEFQVHSTLADGGVFKGSLNIDGVTEGPFSSGNVPINGTVEFDIDDLSFITLLTDSRVQPNGSFTGSVTVGGTFAKPQFQGNVELENGTVEIADLGITLEDLAAEIYTIENDLGFILSATSGPGTLHGDGRILLSEDKKAVLASNFTGSNFDIYSTDEYYIRVSPNIELQFGGGNDSISGEVEIPYARIYLKETNETVSPSQDVIIVNKSEPTLQSKNYFVTDLDIRIGEDVKIDAFGLKSYLTGDLSLQDQPGKPYSALGELQVKNGKFALYSVDLDIIRGRLLFAGGTVEDPGIDFRAERKIDKKTVGVAVSGTASEPQFQLFSVPFMEESDILAYLLVGTSIYETNSNDQSLVGAAANALGLRGVNTLTSSLGKYVPFDEMYLDGNSGSEDMSLVLGKHITEDFFIGYDHNFFDNTGEFRVRYNLGAGFSVETKSSVKSTSGDILYSIER